MIVDIAHQQQQLPELFNRPSSTQKRISTAKINGERSMADDLGKKADQILGRAPAVVDYHRQPSIDFSIQHAPRLKIVTQSRANNPSVSPSTSTNTPQFSVQKNRDSVTVEQLAPLILKLMTSSTFTKLPDRLSKHLDHVIESREAALALHRETAVKLSDDENDDNEEEENQRKIPHLDSDEQVSVYSETENDVDELNPQTFSLMNFLPNIQHSAVAKRTPSPSIEPKTTKRKADLIRSFSSSLNVPINVKQPTLSIAIPTHLFFDQSKDDRKRDANGYLKHENNTDVFDNSPLINGAQAKKSKTSHVLKQEPTPMFTPFTKESNTPVVDGLTSTSNTTTVAPIAAQPKKEKPTANVKPLLQSIVNGGSQSTNSSSSVMNSSTRANFVYLKSRNTSMKEFDSLAREKKKQADGEKHTFEDAKQSMVLYLESVCYFIQCAHNEPILEKRSTLLTAIVSMLQHLAYNYQKRFYISNNDQSTEALNHIQPKFLLINYWLQSYIYQLQFNAKFAFIERSATQVSDYFNHSKSPSDVPSSVFYDFSRNMLDAYHSNTYWNKAERLTREEPSKRFAEQLLGRNQNRRPARDDSTSDFLLYIFDAIDFLRLTTTVQ